MPPDRTSGHLVRAWRIDTPLLLVALVGAAPSSSRAAAITEGPLACAVSDTSALVWVRTDRSAAVRVEFSTDPKFSGPIGSSPTIQSQNAADETVTLDLGSPLTPATTYYYRVLLDDSVSTSSYSFTTFPRAGSATRIRFAVMADLESMKEHPTTGAPAYAAVAAAAPAFLLQIGDFDHRNPKVLTAMRKMHRDCRGSGTQSGSDFAASIAPSIPVFHIWDNHDYGGVDRTFAGRFDAWRVFREYWPTPPLPLPPDTTTRAGGFWYTFTCGPAQFYVLDLRSQRSPAGHDPLTILGLDQKTWLKDALAASTATWKFVITSLSFNGTVKRNAPFTGSWGAYSTERVELAQYIRQSRIQNVVFLSADLHSGGAIDDGTHTGVSPWPGPPEISVPHTNVDPACDQDSEGVDTGIPRDASCALDLANDQSGTWNLGGDVQTYVSGYSPETVPSGYPFPPGGPGFALVTVDPDRAILTAFKADGTPQEYAPGKRVELELTSALTAVEQREPDPERPRIQAASSQSGNRVRMTVALPSAGAVRLDVLDVGGRVVRSLDLGRLDAGEHALTWDGRDARGGAAPSGHYFVRLRVNAADPTGSPTASDVASIVFLRSLR